MRSQLLLAFISFLILSACKDENVKNSKSEEYKNYTSDTMKISLDYPSDWEIIMQLDSNRSVSFIETLKDTSDNYQENIKVWIEDMPYAIGDSLYKQAALAQLNILNPDLPIESQPDLKTSTGTWGHYSFEFTTQDSSKYRVDGYTSVKDKRGYNLTFTAESKNHAAYKETLQHIVESFKLKP